MSTRIYTYFTFLQWTYLPLLGNKTSDQWHYAVSIHTAMGSARRLDVIPCLSVIGQYGRSRAIALVDGIREVSTIYPSDINLLEVIIFEFKSYSPGNS